MTSPDGDFLRICGRVLARQEQAMALLARELHDQLGGVLTAVRMDLSWLQQRLPPQGPEFAARFGALDAGLAEAMKLKRRAVEVLRPALLDHFGLPAALRHLFEESCAAAETQLSAVLPESLERLDPAAATAVFRIAQEALVDLVARPGSRHVDLVLEVTGPGARLSIEDDNPLASELLAAATRAGTLAAMQARIAYFGGAVDVTVPRGIAVILEVPFSRP